MESIRIGNPVLVKWSFYHRDGTPFPIGNYSVELFYYTGRGKTKVTDTTVLETEGNLLTWLFNADAQHASGIYSLSLKVYHEGNIVGAFEARNVFALTSMGCIYEDAIEVNISSKCDFIPLQEAVNIARQAADAAYGAAQAANDAAEIASSTEVTVGRTETGAPGSSARVSGAWNPDTRKLVLNFVVPRGATGATGAQGPQGNSGYSGAADELEVVNNLTDGGAAAALSAEMGKELDSQMHYKDTSHITLIGQGATYVSKRFSGLIAGHTYRVYLENYDWARTQTSSLSSIALLYCITVVKGDNSQRLVERTKALGVSSPYYDFTVPVDYVDYDYFIIGARGDTSTIIRSEFADLTSVNETTGELSFRELSYGDFAENPKYITGGVWTSNEFASHYRIPVTAGKTMRIVAGSQTAYYAFLTGTETTGEASFVAGTELMSLTHDQSADFVVPVGTNYLYINIHTSSSYDHRPKAVYLEDATLFNDYARNTHFIPAFATQPLNADNANGKFTWGSAIYTNVDDQAITIPAGELAYNTYAGSSRNLAIVVTKEGNLQIRTNGAMYLKGAHVLASYRRNSALTAVEKIYFCSIESTIDGRGQGLDADELVKATFNSSFNTADEMPLMKKFSSLLKDTDNVDTFLFFTDPHLTDHSRYETITEIVRSKYISALQKAYNSLPLDFILCGGDWLNFQHTDAEACAFLGYCDAYMRKLFRNYYPMLGNHDNNPYNPDSSQSSWLNALTYKTCRNLMFRENGNTWYSFDANNSKWYVLNSGVSFIKTMTDSTYSRLVDNRWQQVAWLGQRLLADDAGNSVVTLHIYANASNEEQWHAQESGYSANGPHDLALNVRRLVTAYNRRETITLNGITYHFASCTGRVEFILTGHTHFDYVDTEGEVPVVCTTNLEGGHFEGSSKVFSLTPTFDNCIIDHDGNRLHMVREGAAVSRTINFVPIPCAVGASVNLETRLGGTITWASRDALIASVSNGIVNGVSAGIVGIIADNGTEQEYYLIKVI